MDDSLYREDDVPPPGGPNVFPPEEIEGQDDEPGIRDKAEEAVNRAAGKFKQKFADVTDDERLEAEGARQELEAEAERASGEHSQRRDI